MFNSTLKLKVYARGSGEVPDRVLGFTPSRRGHSVRIPPHQLWYVRPIGPLSAIKLERLVHLITIERIPGLDLSDHWELTNESLSHLRSLAHLVMLDISRTKMSDAGLASLKSCRSLAVLMLPDKVTDEGLVRLKKLQKLRELNLDQTRVTDQGLNALTQLPNLENLDLSSTRTTDAGVAYLKKLPRLRRLVLGAAVTDSCAPHLAELKDLREIDISQTPIGAQGLATLASLSKLETLYVGRQVTDAGLKALSPSRSLRTLDLTRTAITDKGVKYLANVKTLEEISLSQTSVGNACLSSLAELPELRMLELSDTRVTSAGLSPLARLKKLEVISLSWQTLSREDLQGMAKLKQLKTIVLNGVPLPEATMAQLKRLGTPSPWDSMAGLEHAQLRDTVKTDHQILGAPVAISTSHVIPAQAGIHKPLVLTPVRPSSKEEQLVSLPDRPAFIDARKPSSPAPLSLPLPSPPLRLRRVRQDLVAERERTEVRDGVAIGRARPSLIPTSQQPLLSLEAGPSVQRRIGPMVSLEGRRSASSSPPSAVAPLDVATKKSSEDYLLQTITLQSNPAHAGAFAGLSGMRQLRHTETVASLNSITADMSQTAIREQEDKPENYLGDISVGAGRSR